LASTSQETFHRDYIPPRKYNAPHIKVPADGKYLLATSPIPLGVSIGGMLDKLVTLNFLDHDITDEQKFPEMAREKYLCTKSVPDTVQILLETHMWATRLKNSGTLNLFEVPHFRCILEINACVNLLLSCIHGGTLWLEPPASIDIALILRITGLPKVGGNSTIFSIRQGRDPYQNQ
jgi:hypothetical protein